MPLYQVPDRPTSPFAGSIAELLGRSAEIQAQRAREVAAIQAQAAMQQGQGRANTIGMLGQVGAQTLGGILGAKQQQKQQRELNAYLESGRATIGGLVARGYSPQEAAAFVKGSTPEQPEPYTLTPGSKRFGPNNAVVAEVPTTAPTPSGFNLSPGQTRYDAQGSPIATSPAAPEKPKDVTYSQPGVQMVDGKRALVRAGSDGKLYDVDLKPIESSRIAPPPDGEKANARFWVFRDGKPIRVNESEYKPGDLPSNTREQGRPVTAGDAEAISDFDTSLDDLDVLTEALSGNQSTGMWAKVGAKLWNPVTEFTGWGAEAKSKQALIDRVKQVIGKTLEGGVLRKEDEIKYEKILPTIGDPQTLVADKLKGLSAAILRKKGHRLDSLEDASYDVGKYRARSSRRDAPKEGTDGSVGGVPAVWKTVDGVTGWYKK